MKYSTLIFSPTGGTEKVVETLTANWGPVSSVVDMSEAATDYSAVHFDQDETVVIAVPSFEGRVPALAVKRLSLVHGNHAKAVIVCVYGNRAYDDTLVEMQDTAESAGFDVVAAVAAIAQHSIIHSYATNRPDQKDMDNLAAFSEKILDKLQCGDAKKDFNIPGKRPYQKVMGFKIVPTTGKTCTRCGLCAKKCPAGAIDEGNPKIVDKAKCIACMRCVSICPEKAKSVSRFPNKLLVNIAAFAIKKACAVRKEYELYL